MHRPAPDAAPSGARLVLGILTLTVCALAAGAQTGRIAQCRVESAGKVEMSGPCRFTADTGGSFALSAGDGKPLFGEVTTLSVAIVSPGVGEVRGLTRAGINSRWGEARRSKRDGACWEGADFRVCAR